MKRFLITAKSFSGEIELIFNESDYLVKVDMLAAVLDDAQHRWFLQHLPGSVSGLEMLINKTPNLVAVEAEYAVSLEDFKREYPYQRNMHLLPDIWAKMTKTEQVQAVFAAKEYRRYSEKNAGWYKPKIAAAWLKAQEYLNDWKKM